MYIQLIFGAGFSFFGTDRRITAKANSQKLCLGAFGDNTVRFLVVSDLRVFLGVILVL